MELTRLEHRQDCQLTMPRLLRGNKSIAPYPFFSLFPFSRVEPRIECSPSAAAPFPSLCFPPLCSLRSLWLSSSFDSSFASLFSQFPPVKDVRFRFVNCVFLP